MASPLATESPTINRAWEAFVLHVPAILLAWIAAMGISVIGTLVYFVISLVLTTLSGADPNGGGTVLAITLGQLGQLPFTVLSSLVGVLLAAIPALYYERGEVITVQAAFAALLQRPWRYLWAGVFFSALILVGFLFCVLPGVLLVFVIPLYVNRIFNTKLDGDRGLLGLGSGVVSLTPGHALFGVGALNDAAGFGGVDLHLWFRCAVGFASQFLLFAERRLQQGAD